MELPRKTFTASRGLAYSYIHAEKDDPTSQRPALLFFHGFPSIAVDFFPQLKHFYDLGYPVIAPDLIGYGASTHPADLGAYNQKHVVNDLIELLDSHSLTSVIGVSHDFGAQLLTRLEFYFPHRVEKLVFLTIGPISPGQEFSLKIANSMTKRMLGFEGFGYQEFLTRDADAPGLLAEKNKSFHDLMFTLDHGLWKDNFGRTGGLRKWLVADSRCDTIEGFRGHLEAAHAEAFRADNGGYEGAKNWYLGLVDNANIAEDKERLQELNVNTYQIVEGKKVLLITASKDVIALPVIQEQMTRQCMSESEDDLTVKEVDSGHWVGIERADEVNKAIQEFIEG